MIYVASRPDLPYVLSDFTDIATLPFAKDDRVKDEAMPIITRVTLGYLEAKATARRCHPDHLTRICKKEKKSRMNHNPCSDGEQRKCVIDHYMIIPRRKPSAFDWL